MKSKEPPKVIERAREPRIDHGVSDEDILNYFRKEDQQTKQIGAGRRATANDDAKPKT